MSWKAVVMRVDRGVNHSSNLRFLGLHQAESPTGSCVGFVVSSTRERTQNSHAKRAIVRIRERHAAPVIRRDESGGHHRTSA
jgi:hypothetical protein